MLQRQARELIEQLAGQVKNRADAGRAIIADRFWIGLGGVDEAAHRVGRHTWIDRHQNRGGSDHRNRRKIGNGVVGQLCVDARIDDVTGRHQQQRITVRRSFGDDFGAEHAACSAAIVDHDRLAQARAQLLTKHAGDNVGAAARRIRDNEPDRPGGKCIGGMHAGRQNHHRADNNNHQGSLFDKVHG